MAHARLRVVLPEGTWIRDVSTDYPDAHVRVLAVLSRPSGGVGLVAVDAPDLDAVVGAMDDHEGVVTLDVIERDEDRALVRFETPDPLLAFASGAAGVPIEPPVDIVDGEATLSVTLPHERLPTLSASLDSFGLEHSVESVHHDTSAERPLTDRQHELVARAAALGYYDTPRACTLTALASEVGLAKSTVSEVLHRAEGALVDRYLREHPGTGR
ncbi:helix-turn-helix domain-containing protein [Halomarina ordinaria]|uniref:Helix-turn-helix domain-containing protein n=1 Tax=Halomarina ordinaria TaxID=3033939 RepID=A0ABD5U362_9EURY|nr:helix-turn-helix domain-containing protein [Halomarina sp. PSRA2]